jgi:hypothetical protein
LLEAAVRRLAHAKDGRATSTTCSRSFPCFPGTAGQRGKQKAGPKDRAMSLISLRKLGAGEGIRTLDPNIGKVVLLRGAILRNLRWR